MQKPTPFLGKIGKKGKKRLTALLLTSLTGLVLSCARENSTGGGGCSVEELEDKTGVEISCEDGTSEVVNHGEKGESCELQPPAPTDNATVAFRMRCPDSDWLVVTHGPQGPKGDQGVQGPEGPKGTSCKVLTVPNTNMPNAKFLVCEDYDSPALVYGCNEVAGSDPKQIVCQLPEVVR